MPTFTVIAEAGINHGSFLASAIQLADLAKECGANAVKFQRRTPHLSVPQSEWGKMRTPPWGGPDVTYLDYKIRMEFSAEGYREIDAHCKSIGLPWTVSVWDVPALESMAEFNLPFVKIPSAHLTNTELLKAVVDTGKPIMLSCGMSTDSEVDAAVDIIQCGNSPSLLHCNSSYPAQDEELNLSLMSVMKSRYGLPVGYSNHSRSPFPAIEAMAMGAEVVEAHITLNRALPGTDQAASLEKEGMSLVVREARRLEKMWGDGERRVWPSEEGSRKKLRGVS